MVLRPKGCRICKKILRSDNKSGLCSHHYRLSQPNQKGYKKGEIDNE